MLIVAGKVRIKPESREEATKVALVMAKASQAETGCLDYRFYADLEDPNLFFVFEEWENEEALFRHFQSEHMKTFQKQLPGMVVSSKIQRYDVATVGSLR